jgi:hypothetical protein
MAAPDDPPAAPVPEPRGRVGTALGIAITAVAIVLAVSFGVGRGDDDARIAREVVALHELPPEGPAPDAPGASAERRFADTALAAGWAPIGTREDRLEGRGTLTTYWQKAGSLVAYTTVSGSPVAIPPTGRQTGRRGILLRSFDEDGRTAVAWTEDGHTVVISGIRISRPSLYNLAGGPAGGGGAAAG